MSKRFLVLMCSVFLIVPLLFMGCGDGANGSNGANGANGTNGATGPAGPGTVSNESCIICHGTGQAYDVQLMHRMNADGTLKKSGTLTISGVSATFGAINPDNTVPVSVTFTFNAKNSAGTDITGAIDLRNAPGADLPFGYFTLARLVPGQTYDVGTKDPTEWFGYVLTPGASGSRPFASRNGTMTGTPSTGVYTYTFPATAVSVNDGFNAAQKHRVGIQISSLPAASFFALGGDLTLPAPVANATLDVVPDGSTVVATKDVVTTAACNQCHDPLALHGGGRIDTKLCVTCHNAKGEIAGNPAGGGFDNINLVNLVHGIHTSQNLGFPGDFSDVTFPQDIRNCDTCHKGTDGDNFKNVPSIEGCGSCHRNAPHNVNFATGANHLGGVQTDNRLCAICHSPSLILGYHADPNVTPNNVTAGADVIAYFIDNVTMSGNFPVVTFHITRNGSPLALASPVVPPNDSTGAPYTGSPSFLLAYALPQDGVTTPADYNNLGRTSGQPASVNLTGLTLAGTSAAYTTTLTTAFPAGATMRAIGLQGYWSQTIAGVSTGRHTPGVVKGVTGDAVRRTVVKSGYNATTGAPEGCLECHKKFEGHGGSRVNNVQLCVMCHNPSNTSSGRTIDPAIAGGINPAITALYGTDPLLYPEVPNNMKDMIHGIHSAFFRSRTTSAGGEGIAFVDVRNRLNGVLVLGNEVTYPGTLNHCTKCHFSASSATATYRPDRIPDNVLLSTTRVTTGIASETRAQILAARASMPNPTDLVNSPIAAACYGCHASIPRASHMVQMGADISSTRTGALLEIPWDLTIAP